MYIQCPAVRKQYIPFGSLDTVYICPVVLYCTWRVYSTPICSHGSACGVCECPTNSPLFRGDSRLTHCVTTSSNITPISDVQRFKQSLPPNGQKQGNTLDPASVNAILSKIGYNTKSGPTQSGEWRGTFLIDEGGCCATNALFTTKALLATSSG